MPTGCIDIARIPPQRPAPAQPAPETAHGALKVSRARASEPLLTASALPPLRKNKPSKQRSARPNLAASSDQRATLQPPAQATENSDQSITRIQIIIMITGISAIINEIENVNIKIVNIPCYFRPAYCAYYCE